MKKNNLTNVIIASCITEKSTMVSTNRQYVFKVEKSAKKIDIINAIKIIFKVDVEHVTTCNVKGKKKKFKNISGKCSDWKKAYVKVKEGHIIDFIGV